MRTCDTCTIAIEGTWSRCPLCSAPLSGDATPDPLPIVPLRFSRRRLVKVLFLSSIAVIAASLAAQLLFSERSDDIGVLRSIWLGVIAMWAVVLIAVRKRRDLGKGTAYLVVLVGLFAVYWDYLTDWHAWSISYAVPLVCASSVIAVIILTRLFRTEFGDHIVYISLTALLGLIPILFLALGWVTVRWPSIVCVALCAGTLATLIAARGRSIRHELTKRLDL